MPLALRRLALLLSLLVLGSLAACDNPACVFGGNCFDNDDVVDGALGSNPATIPGNSAWLLPGAPTLTRFAPQGSAVASTTPITLEFSESMALSSLIGSFELQQVGGFGQPVPLLPPALVGDGRLLVLLPAFGLAPGATYELFYREDSEVFDLLGTSLVQPGDGFIGSFTVADPDPGGLSVVTTWPRAGAMNQSETGEVVVVFDRPVNENTVTVDSIEVLVGTEVGGTFTGTAPADYPKPQVVIFAGGGGLPTADTRAFSWRSTDGLGFASPLGPERTVQVTFSPSGNSITTPAPDSVPLTPLVVQYELAPFGAPLSVELVSMPTDAVGIANLDGSIPLEVVVEVADGQPDDRLGIFLFGVQGNQGDLAALFRDAGLSALGYDPLVGLATLGEAEIDLASSTAPVDARFNDGTLSIAIRVERGSVFSPVRLLDVDLSDATPQSAVLDVTRPTVVGLSSSGTGLSGLRSDLTDLVVVGRADEGVRAAEVTTSLGDNGFLPPVVSYQEPAATTSEGLFVTTPVPLGVIDPGLMPLPFTLTIYDRALNAAAVPTSANFRQVGTSFPAAVPPAATVTVEVFDKDTFAAVVGAHVFTHDYTGAAGLPVDDAFTDASGRVTLVTGTMGETVVTVDAGGYDLFSYQGGSGAWLGVPLERSAGSFASIQGSVRTSDISVSQMDKWVADTRTTGLPADVLAVQSCSFNPLILSFECVYGPASIPVGPPGAAAVVAVVPPPDDENFYAAASFLRAWEARLPRLAAESGGFEFLDFDLSSTLDAPAVPQEERVVDGTAVELDASSVVGIDLANLDDSPSVTVQARLSGLAGSLLAGFGTSFTNTISMPTDDWKVRWAYPGAVDPTDDPMTGDLVGQLVEDGVIDADLWVRMELRDVDGNVSGRRPRASVLAGLGAGAVIVPPDVPVVVDPMAGGNTGGPSFDVVVAEVLGGVQPGGLHELTLQASNGRRWVLRRPSTGFATTRLHVPDIAAAGGNPLVNGPISAWNRVFGWAGFDPDQPFAWSDVPREYDAFGASAPIVFNQP